MRLGKKRHYLETRSGRKTLLPRLGADMANAVLHADRSSGWYWLVEREFAGCCAMARPVWGESV